jgi:hypothetical protein
MAKSLTSLISSNFVHCIVCTSIYYFWLPLWYLQTFGHCIVCPSIYYFWLPPFDIFKLLAIVSSVLLFTTSDYLPWYLQTFGHCIVCPSIYYFWLPPFDIFKLLAIVSCVLLFTTSDYLFDIFKLLAIVSSVLLFTTSDYLLWYLQTFGHCIMCPSLYCFWLPPEVVNRSTHDTMAKVWRYQRGNQK